MTARVTGRSRYFSAVFFMYARTMAEISSGAKSLVPPFPPIITQHISSRVSSENLRRQKRTCISKVFNQEKLTSSCFMFQISVRHHAFVIQGRAISTHELLYTHIQRRSWVFLPCRLEHRSCWRTKEKIMLSQLNNDNSRRSSSSSSSSSSNTSSRLCNHTT